MKENKYYTPDISEFHVGFEHEYNHASKGWIKCEVGDMAQSGNYNLFPIDTLTVSYYRNPSKFRVKYLDKSDIEECGWRYIPDTCNGYGQRWYSEFYYQNHDRNKRYVLKHFGYFPDDVYKTTISFNGKEILFIGDIKNKSELKRIMQMLNIE